MSHLTVTEKQHWKERIAKRIDRRIEALCASEPSLMDRVERQARERAVHSLGLAEMDAEARALEEQEQQLERRQREVFRAMLATVRRVPVEDIPETCYLRLPDEVANAVRKRQAVHEEELLAEDALGQQIVRLRREKENLLDTVWLAASGQQIKELWKKVAELLADEPTPLQQEALAIPPAAA